MNSRPARFFAFVIAVAAIAAGVVEWDNAAWKIPGPPAASGTETVVVIPPRMSVHAIAGMLEDRGVLRHGLVFEFDLRLRSLAARIKAGEYAIPGHSSMADIAALLISGRVVQHKLTAAEGLTSQMIYALVAADPLLTGPAGAVPAEGTLLPQTYLYTLGTPRLAILQRMREAQAKLLAKLWPARAGDLPYTTEEDALILASIVEKESALPEERRHIASVFINRIVAGIKLQSDPTIVYGLTRGYPLGHGIRASELASQTPYNTYFIDGLPPTPICNPGADSIAAVLHPEATGDLYFVATGHGGHVFSATIEEHEKNVAALRALEQETMPAAPPTPVPPPPVIKSPVIKSQARHKARGRA